MPAASSTTAVATGQSKTITVLPGASAVIIAGTPVSLGQSGTLVIGTNTIALLHKSSIIDTFTVGSQILTIMPTGFEVVVQQVTRTLSSLTSTKELIILPGDSPITIGTVPISIGRGGTLLIGGNVQVIQATTTKTFTVDGQILIASSGGLIVDLPAEAETGLTTLMTGKLQFVFSTSYISISSLTTWSETTTKLPGQTTPTILPIWPCLSLCASGYNGIIVIPQSPLPPSTVIIPAPFTFPSLTIGSNGRPAIASTVSLLTPLTTPIVSATTTADSITSTMTTVPPGFSTEEATNSLWSTNTWITTSSGKKPTIVPVLVGCRRCGASHGGIILWNLPELPRVSFQLPRFPGLPKFHLPCIKIFGLKISGDCDDPPSTDGDSSDNPTSSPNHSDNESPSVSPSTMSSSTFLSSTFSSSTSSCDRTAVPSCTQICQVVSASGRAVTSSCASAVYRRTNLTCSAEPTTYTSYLATTLAIEPCAFKCDPCRRDSARSGFGTLPFRAQPDPVRRDFPTASVLPGDTAGINRWFVDQVLDSQILGIDGTEMSDLSSADEWPLSTFSGVAGTWPYQVGFSGLYGCTIVIVATPEAIYMAHIWETTYNSEQFFQEKALNFLAQGNSERGWASLDFLSSPGPGTTAPLAPEKKLTIFVIAGRDKFNPNYLPPAYGHYIQRIVDFLRNKFQYSSVQLLTYKAALNEDQLHDGHHDECGKVLIQYDPEQPDCEGGKHPTFRLWVAGKSSPDIRYLNYGIGEARIGRRGTSNSSCPLLPGQSGPADEITVTPSEFPTYLSSATLSAAQFPTGSKSTSIPSQQTFTSTTKKSIKIISPSLHSAPSTLRTSFSAITTNQPVLCEP